MQTTMLFKNETSSTPQAINEILPKNNYFANDEIDDYNCLFCGGPRTSSRRCCSTECASHLNDYSSTSIPSILVKTLLTLPIEDRVDRIKKLADSEHVSFESLVKHFIVQSKKIGKQQSEIFFTPKIAKFINITGKIPSFAILK